MKILKKQTLIYLLMLIPQCVFFSCSDDVPYAEIIESNEKLETRSLSPIQNSKSNPLLHSRWEELDILFLNGGGYIGVPWKNVEGNSMNIPDYFRLDVKKEDGWELMYHTLIDVEELEPNYILFYNRKTAIMKGFYYNRDPENNANLYWIIEASKPSKIIPTNGLIENTEPNKFYSTSNVIVANKISDIGHLNAGWNAFSFEFPYGYGDNSDLHISIFAYNEEVSDIVAKGKYIGTVNIPKDAFADNSTLSALSKLTNIASKVLSGYAGATKLLGDAAFGAILKKGSNKASEFSKGFKSLAGLFKEEQLQYVQASINGTIELTGEISTKKSGLVKSINNVPFNHDYIGLWNFKIPTLYSSRVCVLQFRTNNINSYCNVFHKVSCDSNDDSGFYTARVNNNSLDQNIVINPLYEKDIKSYKIVEASLFDKRGSFSIPYVYLTDTTKIKIPGGFENHSLCTTNYEYDPEKNIFIGKYLDSQGNSSHNNGLINSNYILEENLYNHFKDRDRTTFTNFVTFLHNFYYQDMRYMMCEMPYKYLHQGASINIVVEFTYKDGYKFISSRNYPVTIIRNDSFSAYDSLEKELIERHVLLDPNRMEFNWPLMLDSFLKM